MNENNGQQLSTINKLFYSKGLSGLVGGNNRCYMNACVQCLSNTLHLTYYFLNNEHFKDIDTTRRETKLLSEWIRLLKGLWDDNCVIEPTSFIRTIHNLSNKQDNIFHNFDQQDIGEFINYLIQNLHEALSKKRKSTINIQKLQMRNNLPESEKIFLDSQLSWEETFKSGFSIFIDLFYGQYISVVSTLGNDHMKKEMSFCYDPFSMLNLEIPSSKATIYNCFHMMAKDEFLIGKEKWYSDATNSYRDAKRNLLILLPPKILIIALKRFKQSGNKNNTFIDFPITDLNISPYVINKTNDVCNYDLYAVANHVGRANFGHYFCYCKNINGDWYKYDDANVERISRQYVVSNNAYILFYIRK
jgi:ubiquitin C-terminal hydrolase